MCEAKQARPKVLVDNWRLTLLGIFKYTLSSYNFLRDVHVYYSSNQYFLVKREARSA